MKSKNKTWTLIVNLDLIIASVCTIILTVLTFVGVIARYVMNAPIAWQGEIQIMCYIWLSYFGLSVVIRNGGHIAIDIIVDELPRKVARVIEAINALLFVAIMLYTAYFGWQLVDQLRVTNRVSGVLDIPYWLFYLPMPIGCLLTVVNSVGMWIYGWKHPKAAEEPAAIIEDKLEKEGSEE